MKTNNIIQRTENALTKKIILEELMKMKIDHSIEISEQNLDLKINLLYNDCKHLTKQEFILITDRLRKQPLYGKLPANYLFTSTENKDLDYKHIIDKINSMCGREVVEKVYLSNGVLIIKCLTPTSRLDVKAIHRNNEQYFIDEIGTDKFEIIC